MRRNLITWVDANGPYCGRRNLRYHNLPDFRSLLTREAAWGTPPEYANDAAETAAKE